MATLGRALTVCAALSFFESACARDSNTKVSLPRPDICSGAAGWPGSCRRALGEGKDAALLQRTAVQSTLIPSRAQEEECHTAVSPEPCYEAVMWAMQHGINIYPSWYPGLDKTSKFEEFQKLLHDGGHGPSRTGAPNYRECTKPCRAIDAVATSTAPPFTSLSSSSTDTTSTTSAMDSTTTDSVASTTEPYTQPVNNFTWRASTDKVGEGWCQVEVPQADWNLFGSSCSGGFRLKVLSYNLFWWNLFGVRGGNGGSAGALIAQSSQTEAYDLMGFQECQNVGLVLRDAGLSDDYTGLQWSDGDIALGLAFHKGRFERLEGSTEKVAEDRPEQWYGKRGAQWVRLQDKKSKRVVFIVNHHGPLPVDSGGVCGGDATAYNLLRIFGQHAEAGDALVLVGDLNAGAGSRTQRALGERMHRVNSNWVDAIYSSCAGAAVKEEAVLANGGSDHNALFATLEF
mmetsp:Transcript_72009/g.234068  ORF Transcript_72009/g.234068 Transcript_72009/m.234068 type:complete len:458 (+) Transcript_72009:83-1456(+)